MSCYNLKKIFIGYWHFQFQLEDKNYYSLWKGDIKNNHSSNKFISNFTLKSVTERRLWRTKTSLSRIQKPSAWYALGLKIGNSRFVAKADSIRWCHLIFFIKQLLSIKCTYCRSLVLILILIQMKTMIDNIFHQKPPTPTGT